MSQDWRLLTPSSHRWAEADSCADAPGITSVDGPSVFRLLDPTKHSGLMELIRTAAMSLENWLQSLNEDKTKLPTFCERYDQVYSDVRINSIKFDPAVSWEEAS